ncbi:MAG: hypothetical protein ACREOO_23750 [bacterium]
MNSALSRFIDTRNNTWDEIYVTKLLRDLIAGTTWDQHVEKMMQLGARGLALTLSRYRSHITVTEARNNLADLLYKGPSMFTHGEFQIPEDIKAAARTRVGDKTAQRLEKWERMINTLQHSGVWEKMEAVNKFFNHAITAITDRGTALGYDYWQSPIETLVRGKGDCDEKLLTRFQDDLSEERISSYPYQKFPAVASTFINSCRLLPKSAWAQCDKGYECICPRVGIDAGGAETSARLINFEEN